jgi:hypothetical protein
MGEVWRIVCQRVQSGMEEDGRWHRTVSASFLLNEFLMRIG